MEPILINIKVIFHWIYAVNLPVFKDLCKQENLLKCVHGCTQNRNESFN